MAPTKEDTVVPPGDCKASVAMINANIVYVKREISGCAGVRAKRENELFDTMFLRDMLVACFGA